MPATIQIPTSLQRARRTAASAWLERTNPLAGLSIRAAQRIYDAARGGDFSRIQYIYSEIEQEDPVLMTCVDRRASALSGLGWKVSTQQDGAEADEQKAALEERLAEAEGLDEALEHLALAFFRGYAHARPLWDGPGKLAGFDLPNNWNFARDPATKQWFWNERAEYCDPSHPGPGLVPVPPGELVTVQRVRAIDRPALACALRDAVGERDWGRFLERYGIPFVVFTAPPTASDDTMPRFAEAAEKIADGLSTAVPAGSTVSFAGEARNADPFTPFVEQIHKLIVLMSTGGTLTSLAESGAGTLAGNAQMKVWEQIVKRDGVAIGAALDRGVCRPLLRGIPDFAGRAPLVKFELGGDRQLDPGEIFDIAAKARQAGYRISKDELERATGYTLEEDPSAGSQGAPGGSFGFPNEAPGAGKADSRIAKPLQNARSGSDGKSPDPEPAPALKRVLAAFRSDLGPAAEELQRVLDLPEAEMRVACKDLADRLPDLLPADPAMAAILAEELAGAFAEAAGEANRVPSEGSEDFEPLTNADQTRGKTTPASTPGSFAPSGGGSGESEKAKKKREKRERQEKNRDAGRTNYATVQGGADCRDFMRSETLGRIGFYQGNEREGYLHIVKRAGEDAGHAEMLKGNNIPDTLAYGKYYRDTYKGTSAWAVVGSGGKCVILGEDGDGVKIITAFILSPAKQAVFAGKKAIENAEVEAP